MKTELIRVKWTLQWLAFSGRRDAWMSTSGNPLAHCRFSVVDNVLHLLLPVSSEHVKSTLSWHTLLELCAIFSGAISNTFFNFQSKNTPNPPKNIHFILIMAILWGRVYVNVWIFKESLHLTTCIIWRPSHSNNYLLFFFYSWQVWIPSAVSKLSDAYCRGWIKSSRLIKLPWY